MKTTLIILFAIAALGGRAAAEPSAEDLYTEGQAAYDRADYPTAIARWRASYEISGESGLLFNLAQALRLAGNCSEALATYKKFVAVDPDPTSEQHKLADDLARELDAKCPAKPATPTQIEHPVGPGLNSGPSLNLGGELTDHDDRPAPGRSLRVAGLVTGGAGVAILVTGLVVGHHANTLGGEVTDACATSCDWATLKSKDAAGRRDEKIGYVLDGVGVVAIASGALMYYLGNRNSAISVVPAARDGGAVLSWSGSW